MDYYYRHLGDGRCEVICTRCSAHLGVAKGIEALRGFEAGRCFPSVGNVGVQAVRALEEQHVCAQQTDRRVIQTSTAASQLPEQQLSRGWVWSALLVIAAVLFLYGLPTLLEFVALRTWSPWVAVVFPGNIAGCLWLVLAFRKIGFGMGLYLALLTGQALLYGLHLAHAGTIFWISDAIPTAIVACMILSRRSAPLPNPRTS